MLRSKKRSKHQNSLLVTLEISQEENMKLSTKKLPITVLPQTNSNSSMLVTSHVLLTMELQRLQVSLYSEPLMKALCITKVAGKLLQLLTGSLPNQSQPLLNSVRTILNQSLDKRMLLFSCSETTKMTNLLLEKYSNKPHRN